MKPLGELLRRCREAQGLSLEDVACLLGHKNRTKTVRKLMTIEATGVVSEDMLVKLAEVLGLDWVALEEVVLALHEGDFAER